MNNETEEKRPNYLILVIILIIFLLTLGILVYYVRFQTSIAPKASSFNTAKSISVTNSYVFASPVRASAGGDLIRVTVFILDSEGNGLFDQKVVLKSIDTSLVVKDIQSLTDETGKAIFDLSSDVTGNFAVDTYANNIQLPQSLKVIFDSGAVLN